MPKKSLNQGKIALSADDGQIGIDPAGTQLACVVQGVFSWRLPVLGAHLNCLPQFWLKTYLTNQLFDSTQNIYRKFSYDQSIHFMDALKNQI